MRNHSFPTMVHLYIYMKFWLKAAIMSTQKYRFSPAKLQLPCIPLYGNKKYSSSFTTLNLASNTSSMCGSMPLTDCKGWRIHDSHISSCRLAGIAVDGCFDLDQLVPWDVVWDQGGGPHLMHFPQQTHLATFWRSPCGWGHAATCTLWNALHFGVSHKTTRRNMMHLIGNSLPWLLL